MGTTQAVLAPNGIHQVNDVCPLYVPTQWSNKSQVLHTGKLRMANGVELPLTERGLNKVQAVSGSVNMIKVVGPETCCGFCCKSLCECCFSGCCFCMFTLPVLYPMPPAFLFNEEAGERSACCPDMCTGCHLSPCVSLALTEFMCCYHCCACRAVKLEAGLDIDGDFMSTREGMYRPSDLRARSKALRNLQGSTAPPEQQLMRFGSQRQYAQLTPSQQQQQHHHHHQHHQQQQDTST